MKPRYREISYTVPLAEPLNNQAWIAESQSEWRLVVFPGTPARKYLFERFLRLAPEDLEVVLLARPGYARGHAQPYLAFEDQVAAARPFLGEKKIIAMGVSYGGQLALKTAIENPGSVKGVVTLAALIQEPRPYVLPFVELGGAPVIRDILPRTLHYARAEVVGRRQQAAQLFGRLKDLEAPVTILHGDADHLVSSDDARALRNFLGRERDVELREIKGGSHFLEAQFPKQVYDAVKSTIARAQAREGKTR